MTITLSVPEFMGAVAAIIVLYVMVCAFADDRGEDSGATLLIVVVIQVFVFLLALGFGGLIGL